MTFYSAASLDFHVVSTGHDTQLITLGKHKVDMSSCSLFIMFIKSQKRSQYLILSFSQSCYLTIII